MIFLRSIHDSILIIHLSYLGVYQDESKIRALQINDIFGGFGTQLPKSNKTVVHVSTSTLVKYKYISHCTFELVLGVVGFLF